MKIGQRYYESLVSRDTLSQMNVQIATVIVIAGETQQGSRSILTPASVYEYGNVTTRAAIDVPRCCCITASVEYVSGVTDGTTTPTPSINVIDGSISIKKRTV